MVLSKCISLLALATGSRISELHALHRQREFLAFGENDCNITFHSQYTFLAKNKDPVHRRDPILIQALLYEDGTPIPISPVAAIGPYLKVTTGLKEGPLSIHHDTCKLLTKDKSL